MESCWSVVRSEEGVIEGGGAEVVGSLLLTAERLRWEGEGRACSELSLHSMTDCTMIRAYLQPVRAGIFEGFMLWLFLRMFLTHKIWLLC